MKISALAVLCLATGLADATKLGLDAKSIQKNLNKVDRPSLLRMARKLEQEEEEQEAEAAAFELTADYTVQFNSCTSLKVLDIDVDAEDDDGKNSKKGNDEDNIQSAYKDYVIFEAKDSSSGDSWQFAMDVSTFVQTLIPYKSARYEDFCDACQEGKEYCEDLQDGDEDEQDDEDGEEANSDLEAICDICSANSCFEDQDVRFTDEYGNTSDDALNWLEGISACQQISDDNGYASYANYLDAESYAGFVCNQAGTGVEIGIFSDETCSIPSEAIEFSTVLSSEATIGAYFKMTQGLVEGAFTQTFSCKDDIYGEEAADDEADVKVSEICTDLIGDYAVELSQTCDEDGDYTYDENGNAWGNYYDKDSKSWISYDVQDYTDLEQVCLAIQGKEGSYETAAYPPNSSVYDYSGSSSYEYDWEITTGGAHSWWESLSGGSVDTSKIGSWINLDNWNLDFDWDWDEAKAKWQAAKETTNDTINQVSERTGLKRSEVAGIVVGTLMGFLIFGCCSCWCFCRRRRLRVQEDANTKSVRLIQATGNPHRFQAEPETSTYGGMVA